MKKLYVFSWVIFPAVVIILPLLYFGVTDNPISCKENGFAFTLECVDYRDNPKFWVVWNVTPTSMGEKFQRVQYLYPQNPENQQWDLYPRILGSDIPQFRVEPGSQEEKELQAKFNEVRKASRLQSFWDRHIYGSL